MLSCKWDNLYSEAQGTSLKEKECKNQRMEGGDMKYRPLDCYTYEPSTAVITHARSIDKTKPVKNSSMERVRTPRAQPLLKSYLAIDDW